MKLRKVLIGMAGAMTLVAGMGTAFAADPIKVGLLEDVSGDLGLLGKPKLNGSQLAVEEINKAGGIMGRPIELIHLDPQGDNARYPRRVKPFARSWIARIPSISTRTSTKAASAMRA